jgi:hypothetical protein
MSPRTLPALRAVAAGLLLALALLWWLLPRGVAELTAKVGSVERDQQATLGRFASAALGTVFEIGDGLRTGAGSSADVTLSAGPLLRVRAATLVRFRKTRGGVAQLALAHGEVSIYTVEEPVLLETAAGLVRIMPRSRAVLREQAGQTWVDVVLGRAELEWASTARAVVEQGEVARYDHARRETLILRSEQSGAARSSDGSAERKTSSDAGQPATQQGSQTNAALAGHDAAVGASASATGSDAQLPSGVSESASVLPDLFMPPGESLAFLDPAPPTLLGFEASCVVGQLLLELEQKGRFVPASGLVQAFDVGSTRYRLRCGNKLVRSGRVRVVHDAGHKPLAELPPQNRIEADGRAYTVLYQTRLPDIRVHWASARGATRLVVESGPTRRVFPAAGAQADLPSGALAEGSHKLWFEQAGSDLRSRTTELEIRFDNATPMARLSDDAVAQPDGSLSVSGVVVTGARVSIAGEPVSLDAAGRFRATLRASARTRGFAVMVELPRRSVVYYVRRFRSPSAPPP